MKIATVAPTGRIQISTTAATASAKDGGTVATSAAIGNGGSGSGGKPVCICNANCRLEALRSHPAAVAAAAAAATQNLKKHSGSLDHLLQCDGEQQQKPSKSVEIGYRLEKSYHQINGDIFEITRKIPIATDNREIELHSTLTRKKSLPKQHSQPQIPIRKSDVVTEFIRTDKPKPPPRISSRQQSEPIVQVTGGAAAATAAAPSPPQPIPRTQIVKTPTAASIIRPSAATTATTEIHREHFDRSLRQRHSSRSVGAATTTGTDDVEWRGDGHHQRHSSGPCELTTTLHQSDVTEWLLKLPHKRPSTYEIQKQPCGKGTSPTTTNVGTASAAAKQEVQLSKSLKDELVQILKRPLQRQHSGPNELSLLRNDIFDWLRTQSFANKVVPSGKDDAPPPSAKTAAALAAAFTAKSDRSDGAVPTAIVPKPRKRHSLGHNENGRAAEMIPDWIPYPLSRLSAESRQQLGLSQSSCADITKKVRSEKTPKVDRRLRHSASEVVTTTADKSTKVDSVGGSICVQSTQRKASTSAKPKEKYQYIYKSPTCALTSGSVAESDNVTYRREKTRRHQTQRSATVTDISTTSAITPKSRSTTNRATTERRSRSSSLPRCTDPTCPLLPICTDPDCCAFECYNNASRSLPRCYGCGAAATDRCTPQCQDYRCSSLPRCMDSKCLCRPQKYPSGATVVKHNSLPRCVSSGSHQSKDNSGGGGEISYRYQPLHRSDLRASMPRLTAPNDNVHHNGVSSKVKHHSHSNYHHYQNTNTISASVNGKLTKSLSAASLNSRRRRHKTVHFGENLLREVCQNRKLIGPIQQQQLQQQQQQGNNASATSTTTPSGTTPLNSNIQLLYNFVEGVLSSWVDDDDDRGDVRSGAESEPERGAAIRPMHRCNRQRLQTISRVVNEAAQLRGTLKLGNSRYRHRHWRGTAKECNERFLTKVKS